MQFSMRPVLAILLLLAFGSVSQLCLAQFNSSVEGTVTDPSGAVIPNAKVTLHDLQTGIDRTDATQATGYYRFNGIGPGNYQVIVEANNFAKKIISAQVTQDQVASINVTLALTSASTTLTVTGAADQLNPDETRLQTTLEADQVENLPLQNGSVLETVRVAPGVTGIDEDRSLWIININGSEGGPNAQADGRPNSSSAYQLDGVSIQDNTGYAGGVNRPITFTPIEDVVQEVAIEVNTYSADSTGTSSFKVNMTTKGGTNKFHGSLGDRYSDRNLNAIGYGSSPQVPNARRWYSASLGGPVWKDKTFFFFSYLLQHQTTPIANGENEVMDNDFSGTWAPAHFPNSLTVKDLLAPFPLGNATGGQSSVNTFVNVATTAQDMYGTSTPGVCVINDPEGIAPSVPISCTQVINDNIIQSQAPRVNGYQLDARIDQYFRGGKDRIYGAYVLEPQVSDFLWFRPGFNSTTPGGTRYVNLNYTHIFSPNLISQSAISAVRFYNSFDSSPANTIPFFNWEIGSGESPVDYFGTPGPSSSKSHNYQLHEDVTWTHGKHNVKAGLLFAHMDNYQSSAGYDSKPNSVIYYGCFCNNASLLYDEPTQYNLDNTLSGKTGKWQGNIVGTQVLQFGLYAQDDWKIRPNLLVTLGLRWDDYGNPSSYGNGSLPWLNMISPAGSSLQQNIANDNISTGAVSNAFSSPQDLNILPRVGFAWTPFPNRKLTVHGGVGLYEDAMNVGGVVNGLAANSPSQLNLFFATYNLSAPTNEVEAANLYGTSANIAPPYGLTYTHPAIIPVGVDSHGEIKQFGGGIIQSQISAVDPKLAPQKTAQYSLQVEDELTHNLIAGVGYSGSFSWNQYTSGDYNTFPGDLIANHGTEDRLSSEWGGIYQSTGALSGNYNALILTARQNYHRLSWQASYTWAKTLAFGGSTVNGSSSGSPSSVGIVDNIYDPQHDRGPAIASVPHSFNGSVAYELPGRGLHNFYERALLGGWEISAIATAQSGTPFSFVTSAGFNASATGPNNGGDYLANGYNGNLVNVGPGVKRKGYSRTQFESGMFGAGATPASAITAGLFSNPVGYAKVPVYGNQGVNSFYGPGYLGVDSALHKKVLLPWFGKEGESTLTMGIEGSNILNRANLQMPGSTDLANSSSWAQSTAAYQARVYQVIGRFQF
jgi:hypothetical protein